MSALDKPIKCSSGLGRILFIPTLFVAAIVLSKFGFGPLNSQWHTVVIIVAIYLIRITSYNVCYTKLLRRVKPYM